MRSMDCLSRNTFVHRQRQEYPENSSFTQDALYLGRSAMTLDNLFSDRQSETDAAVLTSSRLVGSEEAFKDMRQIRCGYANPGVSDLKQSTTVRRLEGK